MTSKKPGRVANPDELLQFDTPLRDTLEVPENHVYIITDDDRFDEVLLFDDLECSIDRGGVSRDHVLSRRVEVDDLDDAPAACARDDLLQFTERHWEHGGHLSAGTGVVELTAPIHRRERVRERERLDVNEVIPFSETETERLLGGDAGLFECAQEQVVGQEYSDLNVTVGRERQRLVAAILLQYIAAEHV